MSETIEQTWEQELLARGQLRARQEDLRVLLEERFGPLPEALQQQIDAIDDSERLRNALRQVLHLKSLSDLRL
jgi:hypothetical protein